MFESGLEVRMASALLAFEVDAALFHPPSVAEVIALGESAPMTPALMAQLEAIDPSTLTAELRVGWTVGCQRAANHWEALRATGVVATTRACPDGEQVPRDLNAASELGPALGIGSGAADALVAECRQLVEVLPDAHAMALAGNLSWRKASSIAANTLGMDPDAARRVADKVLGKSWGRSPAAHDAAVRRAVDQVDPAHADRKRQDRERDIRLAKHHYGAGMGELFACLPSEHLDLIWTAADAFARRSKAAGDTSGLDRLRVQFLVHAARSFLTHGDPAYCDTICDPLPADPAPDEPLPPEPDLPASFVNRDDDEPDDGDGGDGGARVDDGGPIGTADPARQAGRPACRVGPDQPARPHPHQLAATPHRRAGAPPTRRPHHHDHRPVGRPARRHPRRSRRRGPRPEEGAAGAARLPAHRG
jgi:hypothetical protein